MHRGVSGDHFEFSGSDQIRYRRDVSFKGGFVFSSFSAIVPDQVEEENS